MKIERTNVDFDHGRDFSLRDGSSNFSDFSQNRNNRFLTSEAASKNRLSKPVKNLHFYNAPSSITLDELAQISHSFHIMPPVKIRTFKKIQDKGFENGEFKIGFDDGVFSGRLARVPNGCRFSRRPLLFEPFRDEEQQEQPFHAQALLCQQPKLINCCRDFSPTYVHFLKIENWI